jgi:hypothetical protein
LLALLAASVCLWIASELRGERRADAQDDLQFACNANERQVTTFSGSQDQTTPAFEVSGAEWRGLVQATASTQSTGDVTADVLGEDGFAVASAFASVDPQFAPTDVGDTGILDGPGTFSFEVDSNGASYELLVCEAGGAAGGGGQTTPVQPATGSDTNSAPTRSQSAPLLVSGGASRGGPVPLMPDGSCPAEFPVPREGACYSL